jgi:hypothetical protein
MNGHDEPDAPAIPPGAAGGVDADRLQGTTAGSLGMADERAAVPSPPHIAHESSVWPAVLAAGVTVAFFGLITASVSFSVLGVLATILGIGGWVGELRHAPEHE